MKFIIAFGFISLALLAPAAAGEHINPLQVWLGLASVLLTLLYLIALWPERKIGRWIRLASPFSGALRLLLTPYRWLAYLLLRAKVAARHVRQIDQIIPGLYLGRRPLPGDRAGLEAYKLQAVVDLCAEFPASGPVVGVADEHYLSIPAMDGTAPSMDDIRAAVDWIDERLDAGRPTLVHCAAGHGRSATVVACLLIARGLATTADEAEKMMQAVRPGVRLNGQQKRQVGRFIALSAQEPVPAAAS
jgi:hypothetical protein